MARALQTAAAAVARAACSRLWMKSRTFCTRRERRSRCVDGAGGRAPTITVHVGELSPSEICQL